MLECALSSIIATSIYACMHMMWCVQCLLSFEWRSLLHSCEIQLLLKGWGVVVNFCMTPDCCHGVHWGGIAVGLKAGGVCRAGVCTEGY